MVKHHLGSIRGWFLPNSETEMAVQQFTPYGTRVLIDSAFASPLPSYGWTGREYDAETGFYYLRARYYDPTELRFIQEDPSGYGGGPNVYAYVGGAVLSASDPSGMLPNPDGAFKMDGYIWAGNPWVYAQDDIDPMMFSGPGSMLPTKVTYVMLDGQQIAVLPGWVVDQTQILTISANMRDEFAKEFFGSPTFVSAIAGLARWAALQGVQLGIAGIDQSLSELSHSPFSNTEAFTGDPSNSANWVQEEGPVDPTTLRLISIAISFPDLANSNLLSQYARLQPSLDASLAHEIGHMLALEDGEGLIGPMAERTAHSFQCGVLSDLGQGCGAQQ